MLSVSNVYGDYVLTRSVQLKQTDCSLDYSHGKAEHTYHSEHSKRQRTQWDYNTIIVTVIN